MPAMSTSIPPALQSLFAKRGFAWADELAGWQITPAVGAGACRVPVLDSASAPIDEIDVAARDDPDSLFSAIAPLSDLERRRLFECLEQAEWQLVDALLAAFDETTWASSKLRESVDADEADWDALLGFRAEGRATRAVVGRQLAEATSRDEGAPPNAVRIAESLLSIRTRLFRDSVRIAIAIAKKRSGDLDWVLALSSACAGLLIAIDRFEPSRGYQFSTYAVWWVGHHVARARADDARALRTPVHMFERTARFLREERVLWARLGRPPTADEFSELADACGLRLWQLNVATRPALAARVGPGGEAELIVDPEIRTPAQGGLPCGWVPRFEPVFEAWLGFAAARGARRDPRRLQIMNARFGIGIARLETLNAIGLSLGVSRERIRQLQNLGREALARFNRAGGGAIEGEPWTWRLPPDE